MTFSFDLPLLFSLSSMARSYSSLGSRRPDSGGEAISIG